VGGFGINPYYQQDGITIYHGDCRALLGEIGIFDLLLTDPPYGIGEDGGLKARYRRGDGRTKGVEKHFLGGWDAHRPDQEVFRMMLESSIECAIFGGNHFSDLLPQKSGWLYWDKLIGGDFSDGELIYTSRTGGVRSYSIHPFSGLRGGQLRSHPTQKPIQLILWVLSFFQSAVTVLDPFAGSGSTLVASKQCGKLAIGIEIEERYCEIAAKRLSQQVLTF
jgi:DNA modification methylase